MTLLIKPPNYSDRILAVFGKRRAVFIKSPYQQAAYGTTYAPQESFLRSLLRPKSWPLRKGWVYWDDFNQNEKEKL
jgi:hypothetical protein